MPKYIYELVQCPFCNEKRKSTGLHKHIKTHGLSFWKKFKGNEPKPCAIEIENKEFKCKDCDFISKTKQSVTSHWWRNHTNDGLNHVAGRKKGSIAWNKGLSKETDLRIKCMSESLSKRLQHDIKNGTYVIRRMGEQARKKLSEEQSLRNRGGKCKWFDVNGVKVQGTWEYNIALKLNELKIKWKKPKTNNDLFKYKMDGKIRSYAPDFFLPIYDVYLEVKGHWWGDDRKKMKAVMEQHPDKKIVIIEKDEYKKILQGELVWS